MRDHQLLAVDVDIKELAVETKNFSGAELEGLVRAAQSTAMNRHIKVSHDFPYRHQMAIMAVQFVHFYDMFSSECMMEPSGTSEFGYLA